MPVDAIGWDDRIARFRSASRLPLDDLLYAPLDNSDDDGDGDGETREIDDADSRWNEYRDRFDVEFRLGRLYRASALLPALLFGSARSAVEVGGAECVVGRSESVCWMGDLADARCGAGGKLDGTCTGGAGDGGELESAGCGGRCDAVVVADCDRECVVMRWRIVCIPRRIVARR